MKGYTPGPVGFDVDKNEIDGINARLDVDEANIQTLFGKAVPEFTADDVGKVLQIVAETVEEETVYKMKWVALEEPEETVEE